MITNKKEVEQKLATLVITASLIITAFLTLPIVRAPFVPSGDITPAVWEMTTNKWVGGQPSGYKEGDTAAMGTLLTVDAGEWIVNVTLQVYESPFTNAYGFTDFEPWDLTVTPPFLFDGNRHDAGIDVDGSYGTGWDVSHDFIWFYNATIVDVLPDPYAPTLGYAGADPNYIGVSVTFSKTHDGPCWMLYGGHLASFGDPLPAGPPESVVNGEVDLNEGAHFMTGVFQSRIKGAGDKTINFKGGNLINIDYKPLIQVIKDGPATAGIGEEITYFFNVSHAPGSDCSPVTMTSVIDNVSGNAVYISGDSDSSGKLDCGETWLYTATYTILASDPSPLKNLVNASGTDEDDELVYDTDTHELTIENYPPVITTVLSDDSIILGDSITDTVTFTGLGALTPTEDIIFQHKAPGESTWTTYDTQTLAPAGSGVWTATSISFTPNEVGTWYFRAYYPGDSHYSSNASEDTAEVLTVGRYTPTITTLLSKTTITLGDSLTDTVTFTGLAGYTPTQDIIFQHKAPGESTWTTYDTQALVPAGSGVWTATSISFTPNEVGTWYFRASYPGDNHYNSRASGDTAEVLDVSCYTPSISTLLSETTIILGESLTDSVTFSGLAGYTPTELIIFQHMAPGEITWTTFDTQALTPAGSGVWTATSTAFTPNEVGTWYFRAYYPGDDNYCSNASGDTAEVLDVGCYTPSITTLLSETTILLGESLTDSVTFTGLAGYTPTEPITFQQKAPGESTWTTYDSQTLVPAGSGIWTATSITFTPDEVGTWIFRAYYPGDDNYCSNASGDSAEVLDVGCYTPTITTLLSQTTILLGESLTDTVTFTGLVGYTPTEAIIFQHKAPGESTWTTYDSQTLVPAGSGIWTATSITFTPDEVGTWYFRAYYPGDNNYCSNASGDVAEVLDVGCYTPSVTTLLSETTIILGESLTDSVTFTGLAGYTPTEPITFQHMAPGEITWTTYDTQALTPAGSGVWTATSTAFTPDEVGTWYFRAYYPGDDNYCSNASGDTAEVLDVGCYTPSITTLLSETTLTLGESLTDTVTFTGLTGYTPTETITFQHKAPGESTWTTYDTQTLVPAGSGIWTATSASFTPDEVGTWYFRAYYPGDDRYCSNASGDTAEVLAVGCYPPSITTVLSDDSIAYEESITDTVTFMGLEGYTPTDSILFQHKAPGESTWTTYDTQPLIPDGAGIWTATSVSFTPDEVGTWYFRAFYYGDDNYSSNASADDAEPLTVSAQPGIHIEKTADKLIIYPGQDITYYFWVNNTGNVRLQLTSLIDDVLGDLLTNPEVQFTGDSNNDGWLDIDETWLYSLTQEWSQTTAMFTLSLPTIPVIINVVDGTVSYYDLTLSGVPDGYDVTNGQYISWCIQMGIHMPRNIDHDVTLYSSYDPNLPDSVKDYEWHQINYILNHKNGYDKTAIQEAIWFLTDQKSTTNVDALALLQEASEFGTDFEPYVGQVIAIIAIGSPLIQRVIFELELPAYPITNNVSIEAVDPLGTPVVGSDSLTVMVEGS